MRKALIHSLAFFIIVGCLFAAHEALAQQASPAAIPAGGSIPTPARGVGGWLSDKASDLSFLLVKWIAVAILSLFSWLVSVMGVLLNYSIYYLVIGMGDMVLTKGFGAPIAALWTIIRDLVNLTFVFTLIYLGITTIISGSSSNVKKLLGSVIISALLVNFSLFFAKATIDVSNFIANAVYAKMVSNPNASVFDRTSGITGAFMEKLNITSLATGGDGGGMGGAISKGFIGQDSSGGSGVAFTITYALGSSFLLFFLAFAFGMGAFLLILRFIMLILLMIFSPIAFLPDMPALGEYKKKWWSTLISQAFMAPVFLFGLYISYFIIAKAPFKTSGDGLSGLFNENTATSAVGILLFYAIALILIIGTTSMAKSMSAKGADWASGATGWVDKKLKGTLKAGFSLPLKPAAYVARNGVKVGKVRFLPGVGTAATWAGKWNDKFERTSRGRALKGALSVASLGALDERGRRKLVKLGKTTKIGAYSYQDEKDFEKERLTTQSIQERTYQRNEAVAKFEAAKKAYAENPTDEKKEKEMEDLRKKAAEHVQKMTQTELEEQTVDELKNISGLLSNKQADGIKDSKDKFTEVAKDAIKEARKTDQMTRAGYLPDGNSWKLNPSLGDTKRKKLMKSSLGELKPADIAKLPKEILSDAFAAQYITGEVLRKIHDGAEMKREDAEAFAAKLIANTNTPKDARTYLDNPRGQSFYGDHSAESKAAKERTEAQAAQAAQDAEHEQARRNSGVPGT